MNSAPHPSNPDSRRVVESAEALRGSIEGRARGLGRLGIKTSVLVHTIESGATSPLIDVCSKETHLAMSLNKLAVAKWIVDSGVVLPDTYDWVAADIDHTGGGVFDQKGAPMHGTKDELINDMLMQSGNTAVRILARGHVEEINDFLSENGFRQTALEPAEDGRFYMGATNAVESEKLIAQMMLPYDHMQGPNLQLYDVVQRALVAATDTTHGVRRTIEGVQGVYVINKTAAFNGDDDTSAIRHDVGLIVSDNSRMVSYALLSTAPDKHRARLADFVHGTIGYEITAMLTGNGSRVNMPRRMLNSTLATIGVSSTS